MRCLVNPLKMSTTTTTKYVRSFSFAYDLPVESVVNAIFCQNVSFGFDIAIAIRVSFILVEFEIPGKSVYEWKKRQIVPVSFQKPDGSNENV